MSILSNYAKMWREGVTNNNSERFATTPPEEMASGPTTMLTVRPHKSWTLERDVRQYYKITNSILFYNKYK